MKFTDGYWNMRAGLKAHFPIHVHDIDLEPDALTVYGPTKRLTQRGDILNLPLLTVRFSSPMPNVIRVQLVHHKGRLPRTPDFELHPQPTEVNVCDTPQAASLTSGCLTVRVEKEGDWRIDFKAGDRLLTGSGWRGMGVIETAEGKFMHEQLNLGVGECVYGLGERFTPFVKNGQSVDLWNEDGGASSEQAYKNIPFYLTNRGYGVFINHPEQVSLEVASEKVERVQFSVPGDALDYFVIYGPTPKAVLTRYTALTGRPALPPAWSFGLWLSTSFTTDYNEETVTRFIQGMADRDLPLHVFHFDCFWMKGFQWVNLAWDTENFPDPAAMLLRLKSRGLRICLWINPYIAQRSPLFDEGMAGGYLVKRPNGDVWQWDRWQAGMALVDFTNPDARRWFGDKLRALIDMGVDSFKTDFGERVPTDVVYFDGADPVKMHNYYTYLYNKTVFDVLEEKLGEGEAVVFARSATTGGQQFPVHWGGDNTATFESMAESLRGGLSLCLSGFGFWSHDIGGFEQTAPPEVYKRWCAFGLLSSHSRLHGSQSYRVPWLFDEEAVDVLRRFTQLKCRLMPYLFNAAREAHEAGTPMMRAMLLEFPDDPACDYLDRQYMLGDSLLVAPVFTADGSVDYYLPAGRWTHFLTGQVIEGGRWQCETHDFMSLPLLVRPNSVLAIGSHEDQPDYDYSDGLTLQVYQLADGVSITVPIPSIVGDVTTTFAVTREGERISVIGRGNIKRWQIHLVGIDAVEPVAEAEVTLSPQGVIVTPPPETDRLEIVLA
ncbi:MAG: alpha-xylosidase [Anaerolineales bacterium]|nr:alpha-xylosidase [Anaerolineales bacterium]